MLTASNNYRMARGVSQSEAAKMTGIAVRDYSKLENGRSYSGTEALQRYLFGLDMVMRKLWIFIV